MNPVVIIHNLPNEPPFVPEIIVSDKFKDKVKYITGLLMKEIQNRALTDKGIMLNMYEYMSPNGYQNKYFPQLVQEVVTIIEYMVFDKGEDYAKSLLKVVPMAIMSIASMLAKQNPEVLRNLPLALINSMISASTQYINLQHNAETWRKGANMYPQANPHFTIAGYNHAGQPVNAYGQVIGQAQITPTQPQYMQQGAVANPAAMNAYGQQQALLAQQQHQQALMAQQQQQALLAQQQALMAQQRQQQYAVGNNMFVPPQTNYVPQVAGGPRAGGIGSGDSGVSVQSVSGNETAYVPQVAGGPNNQVAMPNNQYHAPVAHAAPMASVAPPPSISPPQTTGTVTIQPVENGGEQWQVSTDNTKYRCPGVNNIITRLPYLYNVLTEKHEVIVVNGTAVKQRVSDIGDQVKLSQHESKHYFAPRRRIDYSTPKQETFDLEIEKILNQTSTDTIKEKLDALPKDNEESLSKETAVIVRDAVKGLVRISKPIVTVMGTDWRILAKNGLNPSYGINPDKDAVAMRVIEVLPYQISGSLVSHAQRITVSATLEQLHTNFSILVNESEARLASLLIDIVTKFVNTELQKYFGLNITIDSFVLDFSDLMKLIETSESVEFKTVVSEHLLRRLTSTILYSYTSDNLNQIAGTEVSKEVDNRLFAKVNEVILLPIHSRDIPYAYNGKAGLLLNTEYPKLTRSIEKLLEESNPHAVDVRIVTLDGDELIISPILNDNSYILYK